eukprot:CAMPEP_0197441448 /NCGR_PEP_ID=MMETSP1175-20131217/7711_1 /TAXON_ID=1003142 /ORGANISM="Triceratium dubium, Strain CCMP147" /LENGTH=296 /DNA_ID=CAMNT_0042971721 /DNA_START=108 /DNA_END=995 /DNA_ORIENTATION=+
MALTINPFFLRFSATTMPLLRVLAALLLLHCNLFSLASADLPGDHQQSLHASKLEKIISGVDRVSDMVLKFVNPSRIPHSTPTHLQVQFAGLGRTGTTSLAAAMDILGYRVVHDDEAQAVMDLFGASYRGEINEEELHDEIGKRGFNCSFLYNDYKWAAKQPHIKVVLNGRDPERWVDSWLTVAKFADIIGSRPFIWTQAAQDVLPFLRISMKDIPTGGHPDKFLDRDTLLKGYQVHYNNVRKAVPPERLLEYNVKQGWEPLCEFLKVPVPNVPFPHVNDRFKVQVIIGSLTLITW